jgi:hypothetical protein
MPLPAVSENLSEDLNLKNISLSYRSISRLILLNTQKSRTTWCTKSWMTKTPQFQVHLQIWTMHITMDYTKEWIVRAVKHCTWTCHCYIITWPDKSNFRYTGIQIKTWLASKSSWASKQTIAKNKTDMYKMQFKPQMPYITTKRIFTNRACRW